MTKMHDNIAFNDLIPYIETVDSSASIQTDIMHTMSTGMLVEVDFMTPSELATGALFISSNAHFNYLAIYTNKSPAYVGRS